MYNHYKNKHKKFFYVPTKEARMLDFLANNWVDEINGIKYYVLEEEVMKDIAGILFQLRMAHSLLCKLNTLDEIYDFDVDRLKAVIKTLTECRTNAINYDLAMTLLSEEKYKLAIALINEKKP